MAGWLLAMGSCQVSQVPVSDEPIEPVGFHQVELSDAFWAPRIRLNHDLTIPYAFSQSEETGRVKNFEIAAGWQEGDFCSTYPFDDSDVFKIIEGASYSMQMFPDPELDRYVDELIEKIAAAQEADGYLYTIRTIMGDNSHDWIGSRRWEKTHILSHELYNLGHLYEAGVAHYQATGKTSLLDVCKKSADLLLQDFGWGKEETYPGHQEIEIGLVKLYRVTGKQGYLDLAKFFLDVRKGGEEYSQSHLPVIEQDEAVGHAVRANYMYTGMADVASLTGDQAYIDAIDRIWNNVVSKKLYITGGVGASSHGEAYGDNYELPNMSAYCETCAAIANVFWNHRMFLLHGDARYINVLERSLFNGVLSGLGLSGDRFFYPNPLKSRGQHERSAWFGCACCPSNLTRFLPSIPGYMYAVQEDQVYVNLYAKSETHLDVGETHVDLVQETNYPWDGQIDLTLQPAEPVQMTLRLRIPGWVGDEVVPGDLYTFLDPASSDIRIKLNGKRVRYQTDRGYAILTRTWEAGDRIELEFPMDARRIRAHELVEADIGQVAVQRGPLVYCLEWPDQEEQKVLHMALHEDPEFSYRFEPDLLNGVGVLQMPGYSLTGREDGGVDKKPVEMTAIPYYSWANRGRGEMTVWIPENENHAAPLPYPTIASMAKLTSSPCKGSLSTIQDQLVPARSSSKEFGHIHWWPNFGTTEWVEMAFDQPQKISQMQIFWFDDKDINAGCRIPASYAIYYQEGDQWKEISVRNGYPNERDAFNVIDLEPVETIALRLEMKLEPDFSSGIQEWVVN